MEGDRIWKLIARKLAGDATEEEIKELEDLLRVEPKCTFRHRKFFISYGMLCRQNKQKKVVQVNYWAE